MNIHRHEVYLDDAFMRQPNHLRIVRLLHELEYSPHLEHRLEDLDPAAETPSTEFREIEPKNLH
jgi:hypothetical protein